MGIDRALRCGAPTDDQPFENQVVAEATPHALANCWKSPKSCPEVIEHAVRMVFDARD
jgi:hypothetical protein